MAFNPEFSNWFPVGKFRFWCQKVLPLVYDDSLSYYEVLCKVVDYLNKYGEDLGVLADDYKALVEYVNHYFDEGVPDLIMQYVNEWLDEHPEATTTVQDGSLTEQKFSNALKLKAIKDYVTPQMFGAKGDGVADDTAAIQAAIDSGQKVIIPNGTYLISSKLEMHSGVIVEGVSRGYYSDTVIVNKADNNSVFFIGEGVRSFSISDIKMVNDASGQTFGIEMTGEASSANSSSGGHFENLTIVGFNIGVAMYDPTRGDSDPIDWNISSCSFKHVSCPESKSKGFWICSTNADINTFEICSASVEANGVCFDIEATGYMSMRDIFGYCLEGEGNLSGTFMKLGYGGPIHIVNAQAESIATQFDFPYGQSLLPVTLESCIFDKPSYIRYNRNIISIGNIINANVTVQENGGDTYIRSIGDTCTNTNDWIMYQNSHVDKDQRKDISIYNTEGFPKFFENVSVPTSQAPIAEVTPRGVGMYRITVYFRVSNAPTSFGAKIVNFDLINNIYAQSNLLEMIPYQSFAVGRYSFSTCVTHKSTAGAGFKALQVLGTASDANNVKCYIAIEEILISNR